MSSSTATRELDSSLYKPDQEELAFYKIATGIQDDDQLKAHILKVQAKAYAIYPYPCIWRFGFMKLKLSRLPYYPAVVQLAKSNATDVMLDLVGNDLRKAVLDGFPADRAVGSDLSKDFWTCGLKLFQDETSRPLAFVPGDVFNSNHIDPTPPLNHKVSRSVPNLEALTSLNALRGSCCVIHASSFFHLFNEQEQLHVAKVIASLLSPQPGSIALGAHVGTATKGFRTSHLRGEDVFTHSPESFTQLLESVFLPGTVKIDARLVDSDLPDIQDPAKRSQWLQYCITRL